MANYLSIFLLFLLCYPFSTDTVKVQSLTLPADVSALKAFKAAVAPSSIPAGSCLSTWNFSAADPCSLPRLIHFTCGLTCSASRVTAITLDSAGYSGALSPLLSQLAHLSVLDLTENSFSGPIPASLFSLPSLTSLSLRSNSLSGPLPPSLPLHKTLQSLDLSHNALSGPLPRSLSSMSGLQRLDLSFNRFAGNLPDSLAPNLIELALRANLLSGPLSKGSFRGLRQLEVVELGANSLAGAVGRWFFRLPALQQVDLANNSLTRVEVWRPSHLGSDLVAVDLGFNRIVGSLPLNFSLYPSLSSLSLRYNFLKGPIPREYGRRGRLRRLFLDGNSLSGSPPAGLFAAGADIFGSLAFNCLRDCPKSSRLCFPSQKPVALCRRG